MHYGHIIRNFLSRNLLIILVSLPAFGQEKKDVFVDNIRRHFYHSEYDSVVSHYTRGIMPALGPDSATAVLHLVAKSFYYVGQNRASIDLYRKILQNPPRDIPDLVRIYCTYAEVLIETAGYDSASLQLALADSLLAGSDSPELNAMTLNIHGMLHMRTSNQAMAFDYFERALQLARRSDDARLVAFVLTNIGSLQYQLGNYDRTLRIYQDVLEIDLRRADTKDLAVDYHNIGTVYYDLNNLQKSIEFLDLAKESFSALRDSAGISLVLGNLSRVYIDMGKYHLAARSLDEAMLIARLIGDRVGEAEWGYALALIDYKSGNYIAACERFQNVAEQFKELKSTANYGLTLIEMGKCKQKLNDQTAAKTLFINASEVLMSDEGRHELWRAHYQLANIFAAEENVERADSLFLSSIRRIEGSRDDLSSELTTYFIEEERLEVYRTYVYFLLQQRRETDAFEYFEKAKARNLSDILHSDGTYEVSEDSSWAIEYFLHPGGSYVFVISPTRITAIPVGRRDRINRFVREYLSQIKQPKTSKEIHSILSHRLFQEIWEPIENTVFLPTRLTIIPDESLYYLPFESLSDRKEFLVEKHEIMYAPSVKIARTLGFGEKNKNGDRISVISRSRYSGRKQNGLKIPDLSYVEAETGYMRDLFRGRVSVFMNNEITEKTLSDTAVINSKIVHFAAHGINDIESPSRSSILLFEPDSISDGNLTAGDIQNLNFDGQLIVLSACETSLGKLLTGEGMLGLTRAFMAAGASSVISTLWNVYDESTSEFMRLFYDGIVNQKLTSAGALRAAKLKMIRNETWRDPKYWAPFVAWGSGL